MKAPWPQSRQMVQARMRPSRSPRWRAMTPSLRQPSLGSAMGKVLSPTRSEMQRRGAGTYRHLRSGGRHRRWSPAIPPPNQDQPLPRALGTCAAVKAVARAVPAAAHAFEAAVDAAVAAVAAPTHAFEAALAAAAKAVAAATRAAAGRGPVAEAAVEAAATAAVAGTHETAREAAARAVRAAEHTVEGAGKAPARGVTRSSRSRGCGRGRRRAPPRRMRGGPKRRAASTS